MKHLNKTGFFLGCSLLLTGPLYAQLTGNNMMEYQLGNIPDVEPAGLSTLYDQLNLQYRQGGLKAAIRLEQFYSTDSVKRDYVHLSQYLVSYRFKRLELKVGNFYESLGRGLLFRSYEIPASIKEERFLRARHGFYRDIRGAAIKYTGEIFSVKAFRGKPLNNVFQPGNELRRTELIEAVQPEISFLGQGLGLMVMRYNSMGSNTLYSGLFLRGTLPANFSYYGEYARNMTQNPNIFEFGGEDRFGAYLSLNYSYKGFGASVELKKYQNFIIGTGISDPPTLVKEHSYKFLNRSIHVPQLSDESGYQADLYYTFEDGKTVTFNAARAENQFRDTFVFSEYFVELYWPFTSGSYLKTFIDYSKEEISREDPRWSGGIYYTHILSDIWSAGFETEYQSIRRENALSQPISNLYLGLTIYHGSKISVNLYYEFTNDENIADRTTTEEVETEKHFYGIGGTFRPNFRQSFSFFAGERRGGPACTSGVCYEVLDFRGLEFRWTTKF